MGLVHTLWHDERSKAKLFCNKIAFEIADGYFFSKKQQDRNLLIYLMEKREIIFARKMIAWQKFLEKKSTIIILGQRRGPRGIVESAKVSSYPSVSSIKSNQTVIGGKNSQDMDICNALKQWELRVL